MNVLDLISICLAGGCVLVALAVLVATVVLAVVLRRAAS